ncbi:type II secretion system protein GspL [Sphingomonas bacterium]|uniref:type II secretion system protein GspL n=1 Tax=Sphingomonas bacterium TaxID=1895847 RepID=UPI0026308BF6|nr:type II secretion system protein GspL [Sphingomonas bacterium]
MTATLLFLPHRDAPYRWWRMDAQGIAEGEGFPPPAEDDRLIAVPPADAVTLHWAVLPTRSPAQATAAARILAGEASAVPAAELHVAVGEEGTEERPIAVVGAAAMRTWLAELALAGLDPQAMVPAPMLLPRPDEGYTRAELAGGGVVRGRTSGFADEARLTELVTGGEDARVIGRDELTQALAAAIAAPALDLRQGPFARRRRRELDWALIRRLAWLALTILLVTLAIFVVRLAKYSFAADALEARAAALARTGLPRGETIVDADRQLAERLGAVRGPGLGFTGMAAAVFAAVRATPGTEVTGLDFQPTGNLKISVAAARESLPTDLKRAIERAGFVVDASTFTSANGRVTGDMTVRAP